MKASTNILAMCKVEINLYTCKNGIKHTKIDTKTITLNTTELGKKRFASAVISALGG